MAGQEKAQEIIPVAGIGASAGGLKVLKTFLEHTPAECGIGFVIVVHLAPGHESHLAELLQPYTDMPVTQVNEVASIERNHVYVIPPNRNISIVDTHLRLSPLEETHLQRAPIDHFFRTLARSHGEQAIGIVLSGSGSDGTVGLKAIKEAGGLVLVQELEEAEFDGMPESAIVTGLVDLVLPVAEMGSRLKAYVQNTPLLPVQAPKVDSDQGEQTLLQKIFVQLHNAVGHDFSRYKPGTILRRLSRRMQIHGISTLDAYLELLSNDAGEMQALYEDFLIVVTNFFREQETYEVLAEEVLPRLLTDRNAEGPIRVWVPGCATGEEAYSLAILFLEQAEQVPDAPPIQIFATDVNKGALSVARDGRYTSGVEADVTPERLKRFFKREGGGYRVRKELRELVLFAEHNLLKDPPFSMIDLISCRNVLIYLQRELQGQIFELFHYALRSGGYLFLGTSEGVEEPHHFIPISGKHSIYQRQDSASTPARLPSLPFSVPASPEWSQPRPVRQERTHNYGARHQQLVERYAPPSVLINEDHVVLHVSENAGRYLRIPGGETTTNLLKLVRDELRVELVPLLYRAFSQKRACYSNPVKVSFNGESGLVSLHVHPELTEDEGNSALVYFLESELSAEWQAGEHLEAREGLVSELQGELVETKKQLRTTIEEYETSKEEMKASNEELQSMNEELRSMTEELETSKEELQSMNEELLTANEENKQKVAELSQLTSDLQNLLNATDIPTIFLDRQLRIQRFTPAANELFNTRYSDRGRPLAHLTHHLENYDDLLDDARQVLRNLTPVEREVQSKAGRHYLLRLRPYRTMRQEIDGVVITLVDVTNLRETQQALQASRERYRLLVERTKEYAMFTMDVQGRINSWNLGARHILNYDETEIIGQSGAIIFTPEDRAAGAAERELRLAREDGQAIDERWHMRRDGSRFWASGVVTSLWDGEKLRGYAKVLRDNTARKQAEEELRQRERELTELTETLEERVQVRAEQVRLLAGELVTSEQKLRHRISQVLHDDLQQVMYAMEMQLQFFRQEVEPALSQEQMTGLEEMAGMIDASLDLTRQLTVELSPPVLKGEGLREALEWLIKHMGETYDLEVTMGLNGDPRVNNPDHRILLFQIVRELLFNVVKHAGVKKAQVTLAEEPEGIALTVSDKGKGFDADLLVPGKGLELGLYLVRERMELFGGHTDIDSQPGHGTRVRLFLPHTASTAEVEGV